MKHLRLARRSFLSLLAVAGFAAGCASNPGLGREVLPPEVALADIAPLAGGLLEQRVQITLRVTNPNDFELPIEGASFQLAINDSNLARGVSRENVVIPALGEALVTAEATASTLALVNQLRELQKQKAMTYALTGFFSLDGLSVGRVNFDRSADLGPIPFLGGASETPAK